LLVAMVLEVTQEKLALADLVSDEVEIQFLLLPAGQTRVDLLTARQC
jgi:hypothetical protein